MVDDESNVHSEFNDIHDTLIVTYDEPAVERNADSGKIIKVCSRALTRLIRWLPDVGWPIITIGGLAKKAETGDKSSSCYHTSASNS